MEALPQASFWQQAIQRSRAISGLHSLSCSAEGKFSLCWEVLPLLDCLTAHALEGLFGAEPAASSNHI